MTVTLSVNGEIYQRWTGVRVLRSLKNVCAGFQIETPGEIDPPILPFSSCVLSDDDDPVITGYVDEVKPEIAARDTRTSITGRSKTADLVDCMLEDFAADTNQFTGSKLDQIARAVAAKFGIAVVVGPGVNVGDAFQDATFEWNETAFRFLERLARQRGVLLTDDPQGDLVLATTGTATAPAPLATGPGGNVFLARGLLSGRQRFSSYTIRSQAGLWQTQNGQTADATAGQAQDPGVPRHRPWAGIAESALLQSDAQTRAEWEAAHRLGEAVMAILSVPEWRASGQLWQVNQLARCTVPRLGLADTLLIGAVDYREDDRGRRTDLTLARPAAFSPEPLADKDASWAGIVPAAPGAAGNPTAAKGVVGAGRGGADAG